MLRIMSIDSGLASCGVIVGEVHNGHRRMLDACIWNVDSREDRSRLIKDERIHRARELRELALSQLRTWSPHLVAIEEFGFLQGQHATACLAMAVNTLVTACDLAHIPAIGSLAREWREDLAPLRGKRTRTSTKGMSKSESSRVRRNDQRANRERTADREKRAHFEAQKLVEHSQVIQVRFNKTQAPHVLDALGLFVWASNHPLAVTMELTHRQEARAS